MAVEEPPQEDDRKPPARPDPPPNGSGSVSSHPVARSSASLASRGRPRPDDRFVCSICLETVDDAPVVTRCGHLFCWPCLYEWLRPGLTAEEVEGAFGRGAGGGPVDALRPPNANRRCCPVCKAPCTVGTVVPVYIQSAVAAAREDRVDGASVAAASAAASAARASHTAEGSRADSLEDSLDSLYGLDVDDEPRLDTNDAHPNLDVTPSGSPSTNRVFADDRLDETLAAPALGLRQRRGAPPADRPASGRLQPYDDDGAAFTPVRSNGTTLVDGFDAVRRRSSGGGGRGSAESTPLHRNYSGVPARPSPHVDRGHDIAPQQPHQPRQPQRQEYAASSSSPFRTALRPRRPLGSDQASLWTAAPYGRGQGRLTSALLGMIDSLDGRSAGSPGGGGAGGVRAAPRLHRADGGLGGTGPEERPRGGDDGRGDGGEGRDAPSSAGAAQEFLSRLVSFAMTRNYYNNVTSNLTFCLS